MMDVNRVPPGMLSLPLILARLDVSQPVGAGGGPSRGPGGGSHPDDQRWSLRMAVASMAGASVAIWLLMMALGQLTLG